jgi:hypothetical protein
MVPFRVPSVSPCEPVNRFPTCRSTTRVQEPSRKTGPVSPVSGPMVRFAVGDGLPRSDPASLEVGVGLLRDGGGARCSQEAADEAGYAHQGGQHSPSRCRPVERAGVAPTIFVWSSPVQIISVQTIQRRAVTVPSGLAMMSAPNR